MFKHANNFKKLAGDDLYHCTPLTPYCKLVAVRDLLTTLKKEDI
jgi:hypothetical protein